MQEWIYDYLKEMMQGLKIEITDDVCDAITEYSNNIADGVTEGYYCSSGYVADCNLKESKQNNEKREIEELKRELNELYSAIRSKGYNFHFKNNRVYECGMEYVGGTVEASYDRVVERR